MWTSEDTHSGNMISTKSHFVTHLVGLQGYMKRTYPAWLGPNDYTREDRALLKKLGGYRNAVLRRKRISARWKWYAQRGFPGSATQEVNLFTHARKVLKEEIEVCFVSQCL